uniref:Sina domain-containing protein n=1 Tax=Steinernema glaseri TaxID=37863 RepID=A0A1I8AI08_9BILA
EEKHRRKGFCDAAGDGVCVYRHRLEEGKFLYQNFSSENSCTKLDYGFTRGSHSVSQTINAKTSNHEHDLRAIQYPCFRSSHTLALRSRPRAKLGVEPSASLAPRFLTSQRVLWLSEITYHPERSLQTSFTVYDEQDKRLDGHCRRQGIAATGFPWKENPIM